MCITKEELIAIENDAYCNWYNTWIKEADIDGQLISAAKDGKAVATITTTNMYYASDDRTLERIQQLYPEFEVWWNHNAIYIRWMD